MRTTVVTGSASGIGAATRAMLEQSGQRVIGVDRHDADVVVDLATPEGRAEMVHAVRAQCGGALDAVIAGAGVADGPETIATNYFGAIATLDGLRPLLQAGTAPRAVVIASVASIIGADAGVVDLCLAGQEAQATHAMADNPVMGYMTSKTAVARWVRRQAPTAAWAGAGIALNAIAPGTVETPLTAELLSTPEGLALVDLSVPMPLGGHAVADDVAPLLVFLTSAVNTHVCGQVIFIDGGADAVMRGDATW